MNEGSLEIDLDSLKQLPTPNNKAMFLNVISYALPAFAT